MNPVQENSELESLESVRGQNEQLKGIIRNGFLNGMTFEDLPVEFQSDREFVKSALQNKRINWRDLPQKWKDDEELTCVVFEMKQRPPPLNPRFQHIVVHNKEYYRQAVYWNELSYHLKMNEQVLLLALKAENGPRWEDIPKHFRSRTEVIATAVAYSNLSFEEVPQTLQRSHPEIALYGIQTDRLAAEECSCFNREFLKTLIEDGSLKWSCLPADLRIDAGFARSISCFARKEIPKEILQCVAEIRQERAFWQKLVVSTDLGCSDRTEQFMHEVKDLLEEFAPAALLSDRAFTLHMLKASANILSLVSNELRGDSNFMESAFSINPSVLFYLSDSEQQLHRRIIMKTLPLLHQAVDAKNRSFFFSSFADRILPEFWLDHEFVMEWLKAGEGFPRHDHMPSALKQDRNLCSVNAIHCRDVFHAIPQDSIFRQDVNFMTWAVFHRPELYMLSLGDARYNPLVKTMAFADNPKAAANELLMLHFAGRDGEIQNYLDFLRMGLDPFRTFYSCILGNMLSTQSVESTGTNLTLLNQGLETSIVYKKLLAAYVGVPTGFLLKCLQKAEENVHKAIEPFAERFTL